VSSEPVSAPAREPQLLTVAEFLALSETERLRSSSWRSSSPPAPSAPTTWPNAPITRTRASRTTGSSTSTTRSRSSPATWEASWATSTLGYVDGGAVTGTFTTTEPFPVRLDLDALG